MKISNIKNDNEISNIKKNNEKVKYFNLNIINSYIKMNYLTIQNEDYINLLENELRDLVSINTILKQELLAIVKNKLAWVLYFEKNGYDISEYTRHIQSFKEIGYRLRIRYLFNLQDAIEFFIKDNQIMKKVNCLETKMEMITIGNKFTYNYNKQSIFISDF
jgi:hypothetical protein